MTAAQMNVRIDDAVKAEGDHVIAQAGYTASGIVRALWELMATRGEIPAALRRQLDQQQVNALAGTAAPERDLVTEGAQIVASFCEHQQIAAPAPTILDYDALREQAAMEQLGEWSLDE